MISNEFTSQSRTTVTVLTSYFICNYLSCQLVTLPKLQSSRNTVMIFSPKNNNIAQQVYLCLFHPITFVYFLHFYCIIPVGSFIMHKLLAPLSDKPKYIICTHLKKTLYFYNKYIYCHLIKYSPLQLSHISTANNFIPYYTHEKRP